MNKNILIITAVSTFLLSACGGGGDNKEVPPKPADNKIMHCTEGSKVVKKGDKVTSLANGTKVKVSHKEDGTKTVCVDQGEAKIN
jgi:hypothetical protein